MSQIESVMGPLVEQNKKRFCLSDGGYTFAVIPVSLEATSEDIQNLSLPPDYLPDAKITPIGTSLQVNSTSSMVSVGSMVYSIGGCKLDEQMAYVPTDEVLKFDTDQSELIFVSCCKMILPRVSPAVVVVDGKIYVFGGFSPINETFKEFPWAEFLDTNRPEYKQKWKALKEPVSRLSRPVAVHYEAETILISSRCNVKQGDIIYNMANESSIAYDSKFAWHVRNPVTVFDDKTVYWMDDMFVNAYELDKRICYLALTREVFPDSRQRFWNTSRGPILVHLKDNLFNIFTLFPRGSYPNMVGIVECTKIRVTKCINKSGKGVLQLDRVGYQSYKCDPLLHLFSVVPIEARLG